MSSFLKNTISFLFFFAILASIIEIIFEKFHSEKIAWGNVQFQHKFEEIQSTPEINTIFLGSSHFYRQIDPILFDSLNSIEKIITNSFNLGVPGLSNPENYYLLEKILATDNFRFKNIFLVLQQGLNIEPENYFKPRSTYFLNWETLLFTLRSNHNYPFNYSTKFIRDYSFIVNFVYRFLGCPAVRQYFTTTTKDTAESKPTKKGYLALNNDLTEENLLRRTEFLSDTSAIQKRAAQALEAFSTQQNQYFNRVHYEKIRFLLQLAESKGINLYFIVTPRMKDYREVAAIIHELPQNNIINLAHPETYPQFYQSNLAFDIGHLNAEGALIFTKELSKRFQMIKKEEKSIKEQ